jgi:RHS repeat-associated protein
VQEKTSLTGTVTKTILLAYDVWDHWIGEKVYNGAAVGNPAASRTFLYDGNQLLSQNAGSAGQHLYLWGQAVDMALADITSGSTDWLLGDNLSTVRDIANAAGNLVQHTDYDSFGNVRGLYNASGTHVSTPIVNEPIGFTGRAYDEYTGLQNNWHRWYDAAIGQWLSEDPIGFSAGDTSLRRYVGNEVTNFVDPSGFQFRPPFPSGPNNDPTIPGHPLPMPRPACSPLCVAIPPGKLPTNPDAQPMPPFRLPPPDRIVFPSPPAPPIPLYPEPGRLPPGIVAAPIGIAGGDPLFTFDPSASLDVPSMNAPQSSLGGFINGLGSLYPGAVNFQLQWVRRR